MTALNPVPDQNSPEDNNKNQEVNCQEITDLSKEGFSFSLRGFLKVPAILAVGFAAVKGCSDTDDYIAANKKARSVKLMRGFFLKEMLSDPEKFDSDRVNRSASYMQNTMKGFATDTLTHSVPNDLVFEALSLKYHVLSSALSQSATREFLNSNEKISDWETPISDTELQALYQEYLQKVSENPLGESALNLEDLSYLIDSHRFFMKIHEQEHDVLLKLLFTREPKSVDLKGYHELIERYLNEVISKHPDILPEGDKSYNELYQSVMRGISDTYNQDREDERTRRRNGSAILVAATAVWFFRKIYLVFSEQESNQNSSDDATQES